MSTARDKLKGTVRLEDVCFYFDGVERDRLDAAGWARKSGEVLALRERLLRLPEAEFDAVIKTVRAVIAEPGDEGGKKSDAPPKARLLYDSIRPGSIASSATTKVSPA